MKILVFYATFSLSLLGAFGVVEKNIRISADAMKIQEVVESVETAVNETDAQRILDLMSKESDMDLKEDIVKSLYGKKLELKLQIESDTFVQLSEDKVKVEAKFNVSGIDYERKNEEAYFTFIQEGENWLIYDTNFHEKLREKSFFLSFFVYFFPISLIVLFLYGFWALMFYDLIKSPVRKKKVWIILFIVFQFAAALAFWVYKKRNKERFEKMNEKSKNKKKNEDKKQN